jgi:hypothetical protein
VVATVNLNSAIAEELTVPDPPNAAKAMDLLCGEKKTPCVKHCNKPSCGHPQMTGHLSTQE